MVQASGLEVGTGNQAATFYIEEGRVGINTENPTSALEVSGLAKFSERPSVNGTGVLLSGEVDTSTFYPRSNPSGFITSGQTGAFYPRSNPSGFITSTQTGAFYAASNPSGFITGDLSTLYPRSNPSGYISSTQTGIFLLEDFVIACSDESTALITGASAVTFRVPFGMYLNSIRASVNTAPIGSAIVVDVKQTGSSIFSTKLSIDANEETSTTAATPAVISNPNLTDDAKVVVSIDQVGSATPGKGLKLTFKGYRV